MAKSWSEKGVSQDKLKKKDEEKGKGWSSDSIGYLIKVPMYIPKDGENNVRIIQPLEVESLGHYGQEVHFHRNVGAGDDYFICLKRMVRKACCICERQTSELWDEDPDLAKTYYPDTRMLFWVLDLNGDDPEKALLWSCPKTLAEDILGQSHRKGSQVYIDISHPFKGRPVFFDREGKGKLTKYKNVQISDEETELSADLLDEIQEFKGVIIWPEYAEVLAAFDGEDYDPDGDNDANSSGDDGADNPECYGKEFDDYQDCDDCEVRDGCNEICNPTEDDVPDSVTDEPDPEPDPEPEPEETPDDCFQKEYDEYEECGNCKWADDCKPKPKVKKEKTKKAKEKTERVKTKDIHEVKDKPKEKKKTSTTKSDKKEDVKSKLQDQIKQRRKKK